MQYIEGLPRPLKLCRYTLRLVREEVEPLPSTVVASDTTALAEYLFELVGEYAQEVVGVLLVDCRRELIGYAIVRIGGLTGSELEPRDVLIPALLGNAAAVVVFHNHPHGDPQPSTDDLKITVRLLEAAQVVGIELLDHLVLGARGQFVSIRARYS